MEKVDIRDCTLWQGRIDRCGYGRKGIVLAHRLVYGKEVGELVKGMHIDHLCNTRACVNPRHLKQVTPAENVRRAKALITHCPKGHEYSSENTYLSKDNRRNCRKCNVIAVTEYRARNKS